MAALVIDKGPHGLTIFGMSVPEFQVRRARAAGATHAVLVIDRVSPDLLGGLDRLRREGMSVALVRNAAEAADHLHPDEAVILISGPVIVRADTLASIAHAVPPTLLTMPERAETVDLEMIDAQTRWTGIALVTGTLVRETSAELGDWDLASTVLRRAVQAAAGRIEDADALLSVGSAMSASRAANEFLAQVSGSNAGWGGRLIVGPCARDLARILAALHVRPSVPAIGGLVLVGLAVLLAMLGWLGIAMALFAGGLVIDQAAGRLLSAAGIIAPFASWAERWRTGSAVLLALSTGAILALRTGQWGCALAVAVTVVAMTLSRRVGQGTAAPLWFADTEGQLVIALIGLMSGLPLAALATVTLHATIGLTWQVWRLRSDRQP